MESPTEQDARERIEERRQRRKAGRWLLAISLPFMLVFVGSCAACTVYLLS